MKKSRLVPFALAAALVAAQPQDAAAADRFVAGTEDVPLMAGLKPVDGSSLVFDKPQGRIVEAQAKGRLTRDRVRAFYTGTLPQLGWIASSEGTWQREGEVLRIEVAGRDGDITVGFTLSPHDEAPRDAATHDGSPP
jgi:hypothetical protein